MSPLSTSLPAPQIVWDNKFWGPVAMQNPSSQDGTGPGSPKLVTSHTGWQRVGSIFAPVQRSTASQINRYDSYQGVGAAADNFWGNGVPPNGRGAMAMRSAANDSATGAAICPPDWMPQLTTAGLEQNAGSRQDAASLVAVFDFHLLWEISGASPMQDNQAGIWFFPYNTLCDARAVPAANLIFNNCFSGFGVFVNNVGGVGDYVYTSWHGEGTVTPKTVLEAIAFGANLDVWNTIRFLIVGATNTEAATLEVFFNGVSIAARQFGTSLLEEPEDSGTTDAPGMACGLNTAGTDFVNGQYHIKTGRFRPSGAAVEPA